ncbi:MAG: hypothetical protein IPK57_01785 [Chitinophagaceae bacterium]|nr:hypothetical protein [Chitinophagaceae bacterium]
MKRVLLFTFLFAIFKPEANSQNPKINLTSKNIIKYEAEKIKEQIVDASDPFNQKVLRESIMGINVEIYVDTVFKRYVVDFVTSNNDTTIMVLDYFSDYISGSPNWYYMTCQGYKFILMDGMDGPFNFITIDFEEPLKNGNVMRFRINTTKRVPNINRQ